MSRIARKDFNTSFFHIIVQGVNKEYIFYKREYIEKYLQLITKYKEDYNITILAYCIMNNHAHLLIYTNNIKEMSSFMHRINGIYAQHYNKNEGRVGIVFRNRYQSEPIFDEKYLIECIRYIHENPLKAGIVKEFEKYPYSTCSEYIKNTGVAKSKILLDVFGKMDYSQIFKTKNESYLFLDIEVNKMVLLEKGIQEFEKLTNKRLKEIREKREILKELIKYLKTNYKITYISMMQRLEITRGEMNSLKKDDF